MCLFVVVHISAQCPQLYIADDTLLIQNIFRGFDKKKKKKQALEPTDIICHKIKLAICRSHLLMA